MTYAVLFAGIVFLCHHGYRFCYDVFGPVTSESAPGSDLLFEVQAEDTMKTISKRLEAEGIILENGSFYLKAELMDCAKMTLQAGTYELNTNMTYEEIINQLMAGEGTEP